MQALHYIYQKKAGMVNESNRTTKISIVALKEKLDVNCLQRIHEFFFMLGVIAVCTSVTSDASTFDAEAGRNPWILHETRTSLEFDDPPPSNQFLPYLFSMIQSFI